MRRALSVSTVIAAAVIAVAGVAGLLLGSADRTLPNVTVDGLALGGLPYAEAEAVLIAADRALAPEPVTVRILDRTWRATHDELGVGLDVPTILDRVWRVGRRSAPLTVASDWIRSLIGGGTAIPATRHVTSSRALDRFVTEIASEVDAEPQDGGVIVTTAGIIERQAVSGRHLDRAVVTAAVLAAGRGQRSIRFMPGVLEPAIDEDEVRAAASEARAATRPITFVLDEVEFHPSTALVLALVVVEPSREGDSLVLRWPDVNMDALVGEVRHRYERAPLAAQLVTGGERLEVVPGHDGIRVDGETLRALVYESTWWDGGVRTVVVPASRTAPSLTTERARAIAADLVLLGAFTTDFPPDAARGRNIDLAARRFDGEVVAPGALFSFWERIGEVSSTTGYVTAGTIIDGRSGNAIGGGLCQVSTTLFNAVALAGYQIDERHPHAYYIERYPVGRDAAVFQGAQDLRWTNDTAWPAYIGARATDSSIGFWLYGRAPGRTVEIGPPSQWRFVDPSPDQPADPQHAAGYVVLGRDTSVVRTVRDGADVRLDAWFSRYAPVWGGPAITRDEGGSTP